MWGSVGFSTTSGGDLARDARPIWRSSFAAFYGPFGGRGDTLVTFSQTVNDSSDTTLSDGSKGSAGQLHRRVRSTRGLRVETRHLGGGKVTLLVGYQHSAFYRFGLPAFQDPIPVGGAFVASVLGPYPLPLAPRRFQWYAGAGGTIVRLSGIALRADTLAVTLSTERTLAPEALLMVMYTVTSGYRVFLGGGYQYLRFGSVTYKPVQAGDRIGAATLSTLPRELKVGSAQLTFGMSFAASGLLSGR
ncbi:MAG TPA: hypothetical protein VGK93_00350 [Candidatus Eisenbacteria bacterium]